MGDEPNLTSRTVGVMQEEGGLPTLSHSLHLVTAAGMGCPKYTNYTKDFKDLLDYVFIDGNELRCVRVASNPPEEVLAEATALPSEVFPSDHLAVAVDLELVERIGEIERW